MIVCETERLIIQHLNLDDADYILKQLNEASFIQFIADKQVRTIDDAKQYLLNGPITSYQKLGFGLNLVLLKQTGAPIGMCGILKRDELEYPDIGYAFLPEFWGKGYAGEASEAVLINAVDIHKLNTILAVTHPNNKASNNLLSRIGFKHTGSVELYNSNNNLYIYNTNI